MEDTALRIHHCVCLCRWPQLPSCILHMKRLSGARLSSRRPESGADEATFSLLDSPLQGRVNLLEESGGLSAQKAQVGVREAVPSQEAGHQLPVGLHSCCAKLMVGGVRRGHRGVNCRHSSNFLPPLRTKVQVGEAGSLSDILWGQWLLSACWRHPFPGDPMHAGGQRVGAA